MTLQGYTFAIIKKKNNDSSIYFFSLRHNIYVCRR